MLGRKDYQSAVMVFSFISAFVQNATGFEK